MWRAISFGVFCRVAPSTREIMRSRKDSPGSAVMRTTIRSDNTRVPPVTDERSPPLSRITGADSQVIADSSTDAIPSITSPSPGMVSPASTTTRSFLRRDEAGTAVSPLSVNLRALVSLRILRKVDACALPRPSATASAKLANSTVNHNHSETEKVNQKGAAPLGCVIRSRMHRAVVSTLPTATTNMTGFRASSRGSSFRKLSRTAGPRIAGSKSELLRSLAMSERLSVERGEMLDDRAERHRGKERQCADDEDDRHQQGGKERSIGGKGAEPGRDHLLIEHRSGDSQDGNDHEKAPRQHGNRQRDVPPGSIGVQSREGGAVVARSRRERIDDLGQSVRSGVAERRGPLSGDRRPGGESKDDERKDQDIEHRQLHFLLLDLLSQVLGSPSHHQSRDEYREDYEDENAVEAGADSAEDDFAQLDVDQRHQAAERGEAVVHRVDGAARGVGRHRREERAPGDAEAGLLAFQVADLRPIGGGDSAEEQEGHRGEQRPTLSLIARHFAVRIGQRRRDREDENQ